ncbi:magnesium chelatase subunit D [Actinoplanes octamycinicus]|uniref:Mg-protoporphyrin IX chelatase n=1 Tax=Actinoplanes octamycinicus TaxID=135948 RepID=A0A7W7H5V6_9ACTN|nr:VWA domain-containing protein [Actinoplanes octamycinicus]MBB4744546.1 magnesium chelatase subunit D [Actinoplanes octamycinicus]GIE61533.1 magnesium chelatase [Actinoplanes octamycinicus]
MTTPYPFSAVVGLDDLRLALLLTSVSPAVGGVLVRGEKGTAKSTVVRALAALLPPVTVVRGCRFACDPAAPDPDCPDGPHAADTPAAHRPATLVELPVGATEDRVVGTLDIQRALADGVKAYEPGLLAAAHRGVLYVDEVNLLPDHLVDLLLDAAAMGRAHVERDGVSVKHAARFLLVGTMNPEEGEPRPQLVDRFGLVVTVAAPRDATQRAEVVRRRLAYELDPAAFAARFVADEREYAARIAAARAILPTVVLPDAELDRIARVCLAYGVDGMRADIVVARCAVALAAWHGRDRVTADDVRDAARLALPHRRRTDPLDPPGTDEEKLDQALEEAERQAREDLAGQSRDDAAGEGPDDRHPDDDPDGGPGGPDRGPDGGPDGGPGGPAGGPPPGGPGGSPQADATPADTSPSTPADPPPAGDAPRGGGQAAAPAQAGAAFRPRTLRITARGDGGHTGKRSPAYARRGRVVGARKPLGKLAGAPHLPATLRAALHRGALDAGRATVRGDRAVPGTGEVARGRELVSARGAFRVEPRDLREAIHVGREANLVLFVVDASGSMAARKRMTLVKTAVLSLLRDAYQRRDRIGMITFRGADAEVVLPPTSSHEVGVMRLAALRTGGRTPLAAGLRAAARTIATERRRDPRRRPLLIVVTDGRATSGPDPLLLAPALSGVATVVVDCESGPIRLGLAGKLAAALRADVMPLDQLEAATGHARPAPAPASADRAYRRAA